MTGGRGLCTHAGPWNLLISQTRALGHRGESDVPKTEQPGISSQVCLAEMLGLCTGLPPLNAENGFRSASRTKADLIALHFAFSRFTAAAFLYKSTARPSTSTRIRTRNT